MLRKINKLEKQHGGGIPFSAMEEKNNKSKSKNKKKTPQKKSSHKHKNRSISPSRVHRKVTKKLRRSKKQTKKKYRKCKCGSSKFTGKEETPRGLGQCEECIPLNVVLKGKDGKLYENRKEGWYKLN